MFHLIGYQIEKGKAQPELKSRSNPALRARSQAFSTESDEYRTPMFRGSPFMISISWEAADYGDS